jgi:predicted RNA-binding Zn ribbon-like protein
MRLRDPVPPSDARLLLDEAQRLRQDIGVLVSSYAGSGALEPAAAYGVNRVLAACPRSWMLMTEAGRVVLSERELAQGCFGSLSGIAAAAAQLVSTFEPSRIRRCASEACGAWFVDTSKAGRRRWCSMALCGNREKASVHRSRLRSG